MLLIGTVAGVYAQGTDSTLTERAEQPPVGEEKKIDPKAIIFEHLADAYGWEVPFCHHLRIPLPVIVRDYQGHWHMFSSARIQHGEEFDGFRLGAGDSKWHNKVVGQRPVTVDGLTVMEEYRPLDISITKNVLALFITVAIVLLMVLRVAAWYKRQQYKAPRRFSGAVEALIEFVYQGVVRPTLGDRAMRFAPYLMTVFFFILVMNLMGLVVIFPGGANLTGNIAVTLVLSLITFAITNLFGTKHYWKEIFWPDVPIYVAPREELANLAEVPDSDNACNRTVRRVYETGSPYHTSVCKHAWRPHSGDCAYASYFHIRGVRCGCYRAYHGGVAMFQHIHASYRRACKFYTGICIYNAFHIVYCVVNRKRRSRTA